MRSLETLGEVVLACFAVLAFFYWLLHFIFCYLSTASPFILLWTFCTIQLFCTLFFGRIIRRKVVVWVTWNSSKVSITLTSEYQYFVKSATKSNLWNINIPGNVIFSLTQTVRTYRINVPPVERALLQHTIWRDTSKADTNLRMNPWKWNKSSFQISILTFHQCEIAK